MLHDIHSLAELLKTDEAATLRLVRDGDVPAPVLIGDDLVRWPRMALDVWADCGCPRGEPMDEMTFARIRQHNRREFLARLAAAELAEYRQRNEQRKRVARRAVACRGGDDEPTEGHAVAWSDVE